MEEKYFYITTTLPYVNANLHVGHALEFVRADAIARHKKLKNFNVYFNTGTDEHGMKIYEKAQSENISAQEFVDKSFINFKESVKIFGLSEDLHYIRTTDKKHEKIAQSFWMKCFENGYIYKKNYETRYCVGCESEKTDGELVNGKCPDHPDQELEIIEEENYFFKYSIFTERLTEFYDRNPNFVVPDFRLNEIKAFVLRGLQDFSISRLKSKMPWGIEVPNDSEHVMYVWFDALTNYISTLADNEMETIDQLVTSEKFKKYWINGTPTQYCGKDNLRFQSAMWQAMLMAADISNSHQIIINGHITADGGIKMSKSLGNVVDPNEIVDKYGTEALRYFLLREVSSFQDSTFTIERFKEAYNANLANGLGNLVSRVLKMTSTYFAGAISDRRDIPVPIQTVFPTVSGGSAIEGSTIADHVLNKTIPEYDSCFAKFELNKSADAIWELIGILDTYITHYEPFKLVKTDKEKTEAVLWNLCYGLHFIGKLLLPMMPATAEKVIALVGAVCDENGKPVTFQTSALEAPLFMRKD